MSTFLVMFLLCIMIMYSFVNKGSLIPSNSMILVKNQKRKGVIDFTNDKMVSKFEVFANHKLDTLYITEMIRKQCRKIIDEYWDE